MFGERQGVDRERTRRFRSGLRITRLGGSRPSPFRSRRKVGRGLAATLVLVALLVAGPSGTAASGGGVGRPTITSDKTDYAPGATVTLTGSGWQRRESVHIAVNDNSGGTWSYSTDVTASSAGGFTTQFQLPASFVASYLVTATGFPLPGRGRSRTRRPPSPTARRASASA